MSEWTRERIRKEVAWDAFRGGEALLANGGMPAVSSRNGIVSGLFQDGRRKLRTVVRTSGILEVECSCAANRSSGQVCRHAVALLLSLAGEGKEPVSKSAQISKPATERQPTLRSSEVVLPPNWLRSLVAGSLAIRVDWKDSTTDDGDAALCSWLQDLGQDGRFPQQLHLTGADLEGFLRVIGFHSRVQGPEGRVETGVVAPLPLSASVMSAEGLRLEWAPDDRRLIKIGGFLGWATKLSFGPLPVPMLKEGTASRVARLFETGRTTIPESEISAELQFWLDLTAEPRPGWLGDVETLSRPPVIRIELEGSLQALDARIHVQPPESEHPGQLATEEEGHRESLMTCLKESGFHYRSGDVWVIREPEAATDFLANTLEDWKRRWVVRVGPKLQHVLKSLHVIRPHVEPVGNAGLAVEISFQTGAGKPVPRSKVLELIRSGRISSRTKSGAQVVVAREIYEEFEPLVADLGIGRPDGQVALDPARFLALSNFRNNTDIQLIGSSLKTSINALNGYPLRDYQREGVEWLVDRLGSLGGALLADEMGLGKTIQSIGAIQHLVETEEPRILVVVPSSLLSNWESEFERFAPELRVLRLHGANRDQLRNQDADVILTSYGTLARDLAFHLKTSYSLLVLDEAGAIRNPESQTSKSVGKIRAARRLALSGTPVENRLLDLWSVFRVVSPGYLGEKSDFTERYDGSSNAAGRLAARISPFVLRRTKTEVAKDLPEKIESDLVLDLDDETRRIYREIAQAGLHRMAEMKDENASRMHLLTVLLRLRQVCLCPKLLDASWGWGAKTEWLLEHLKERAEQGRKTLVFSQFSQYLRTLETDLSEDHGTIFRLDGSTRNRGELVRRFQDSKNAAVFLISLKAGGYGLNLTAADSVIHMDPWWNPAAESQASDRAHRIGQTLPVTVYRLLIRDSVEQRVRKLQDAKRALISGIHGGDSANGWSTKDLAGLLDEF